ncbi:MAG: sulfotransferase family 2 domain-containing protein [Candidatus Paceibacterota bacterium]
MVICHKSKLCFVHIPKTGGTSIEKFLNLRKRKNLYGVTNGKALHHLTYTELKKHFPKLDNYFTFSLVRHPYSRLLSDYNWFRTLPVVQTWGHCIDDFLTLVEDIVINKSYDDDKHYDHFKPQYEYVCEGTQIKVKHLGKLENIEETFQLLRTKFGINKSSLHKNKTGPHNELTDEQKKRVFKLYSDDFKIFGYEP